MVRLDLIKEYFIDLKLGNNSVVALKNAVVTNRILQSRNKYFSVVTKQKNQSTYNIKQGGCEKKLQMWRGKE